MDPITTAIIATLTGGMNSIGQQVIADSYATLKALIKKKFGDQSEVTKAVESLEAKPQSSSRQATLQEEIEDAKVNQDSDTLKLAQELLKQISAQPSGTQHIQNITGSYNASVQGGGSATVSVNQQPKS